MTEMYRNPRLDIPASVETLYMGGSIALIISSSVLAFRVMASQK